MRDWLRYLFFFQAEDGIRDLTVTGVQTCALPIFLQSAALPEAACTVWSNLVGVARLAAGETLLIHGGGSGIGSFAIQFAAALGARVFATARKVKHDTLRELGAELVIDYTAEDFVEAVNTATGGSRATGLPRIPRGALPPPHPPPR